MKIANKQLWEDQGQGREMKWGKIKEKKERVHTHTRGAVTGEGGGGEWKGFFIRKPIWKQIQMDYYYYYYYYFIEEGSYSGNTKYVHVTTINLRDKQCFLHLLQQ
jgi:hypothetical protein